MDHICVTPLHIRYKPIRNFRMWLTRHIKVTRPPGYMCILYYYSILLLTYPYKIHTMSSSIVLGPHTKELRMTLILIIPFRYTIFNM